MKHAIGFVIGFTIGIILFSCKMEAKDVNMVDMVLEPQFDSTDFGHELYVYPSGDTGSLRFEWGTGARGKLIDATVRH